MQIRLLDKGRVAVGVDIEGTDSTVVSSGINLDGRFCRLFVCGKEILLDYKSPVYIQLLKGGREPEETGTAVDSSAPAPPPQPRSEVSDAGPARSIADSIFFGGTGVLYDKALEVLLNTHHPNQGLDDIRNPPVSSRYAFPHPKGVIHVVFRELAYEWKYRKWLTISAVHDEFVGEIREDDPGYKGRKGMFWSYGFGKTDDLSDRSCGLPFRDVIELLACHKHGTGWLFNQRLLPGHHATPLVCYYNVSYRKQDLIGLIAHYRHNAACSLSAKHPPIWYFYLAKVGDVTGLARLAGPRAEPICGTLNEVLRRANAYLHKIAQDKSDGRKKRRLRIQGGQQVLPGIDVPERKKK